VLYGRLQEHQVPVDVPLTRMYLCLFLQTFRREHANMLWDSFFFLQGDTPLAMTKVRVRYSNVVRVNTAVSFLRCVSALLALLASPCSCPALQLHALSRVSTRPTPLRPTAQRTAPTHSPHPSVHGPVD
jgi:hypothetical protein